MVTDETNVKLYSIPALVLASLDSGIRNDEALLGTAVHLTNPVQGPPHEVLWV